MRARLILSLLLLFSGVATQAQTQYDVIITGGRIIDGTGNPWYVGDVAIRDGRIAAIGPLCGPKGDACANKSKRVIDAKGLYVAPGFIDVHSHSEGGIQTRGTAENYLFDGVTSIVSGNCGGSVRDVREYLDAVDADGAVGDVIEARQQIEDRGLACAGRAGHEDELSASDGRGEPLEHRNVGSVGLVDVVEH